MSARTLALTALTLLAFAANSVLCRMALKDGAIDAASFTSIRMVSGALALWLIVTLPRRKGVLSVGGSWPMGLWLMAYAVAFSFAYIDLNAATGALILFGSVQATMILYGLVRGERPGPAEVVGLAVALGGLTYLVLPGLEAPSPLGAALMATAGISWGFYSVLGRAAKQPSEATAGNFARAAPLALVVGLVGLSRAHADATGIALAVTSGALTSGVGYVVWYFALQGLTATRAAVVQLAVPVIVALAGVLLLAEPLSLRLLVSGVLILGGIGIAVWQRRKK